MTGVQTCALPISGHITGAISIPLKELAGRLSELPKDQEIAAYCRGPYCVLAVEAVEMLRTNGFHAVRLEDGVQDWLAHGFSVKVRKRRCAKGEITGEEFERMKKDIRN